MLQKLSTPRRMKETAVTPGFVIIAELCDPNEKSDLCC